MFTGYLDHPCGLGVTSLLLTQWTRARFPVGSISWLRFFWGFPSTVRQMDDNFERKKLCLSRDSNPDLQFSALAAYQFAH